MPPRSKRRRITTQAVTAPEASGNTPHGLGLATTNPRSQPEISSSPGPILPTQAPTTYLSEEAQSQSTSSAGQPFDQSMPATSISSDTPVPVPSIHMIVGQIPASSSTCQATPLSSTSIIPQYHLQSEFAKLLDASVSANTHKSHRAGMAAYYKVCKLLDCAPWPPSLNSVVQFVLHSSSSGLAYSTVRSYLSAISFHCKLQSVPDPTPEFLVTKLLQGMKRLKHKADTRLPITKTILHSIIQILPIICTNAFEATLFSAAFSLAFHGFLRVGELTVNTRKGHHQNTIQIHNLSINQDTQSLLLSIRFSKTDQFGKGTVLQIDRQGGVACPYQLVKNMSAYVQRVQALYFDILIYPHSLDINLQGYFVRQLSISICLLDRDTSHTPFVSVQALILL
uniref:Uncharacterized protein LOC111131174 isoform X2 n=1 Tax=Crassostrea virginica TaxID=6565 RepID=A0A8B8E3L6_CRAVI|nr:uncharacterized protein LOC111131174 isoform X2 [Crassostrea virginica]